MNELRMVQPTQLAAEPSSGALHRVLFRWLGDLMSRLNGMLTVTEMTVLDTDPDNAPADSLRIFASKNGGGKVELRVIYPTGASRVLDTEA